MSRFVLVLAEPGGHVAVAIIAVLIEDDDDAAYFALDLLEMANVDAAFVPFADRLAKVDAIENRGSEGLDADALLGEDALALFLEEAAVIFDNEVFGRIRADARAI